MYLLLQKKLSIMTKWNIYGYLPFFVRRNNHFLCCVYITSITFSKLTERTSQKAVQVSTRTIYKYIISLRNFIFKIKTVKTIKSRVIEPFVANIPILKTKYFQVLSGEITWDIGLKWVKQQ